MSGRLIDIVRMDTRNIGRNENPPSYLGQAQIDFFENEVFGSNKTDGWRILLTSQVSGIKECKSVQRSLSFEKHIGVHALDYTREGVCSLAAGRCNGIQRPVTTWSRCLRSYKVT